jgi:NADH dehydrogenase [ubiquinone] 1 alpha subcomplex assembly factor 6
VLPKDIRIAYIALRAFNLELASIRDLVTHSNNGIVRFVWWKQSISQIYQPQSAAGELEHPVCSMLKPVVHKYKIPSAWLNRMISARQDDLQSDEIESLQALENYAERTSSVMIYLTLQLLGVQNVQADHCASHIGKCIGIVTNISAVPHLASKKGQVRLPMDILHKHSVDLEQIVRGENSESLSSAIYDIACQAKAHLDHSRGLREQIPKDSIPALLQTIIVEEYLNRLEKCNFNIFDPSLLYPINYAYLHFAFRWNKLLNKF